jgi:lipopolysaccharide transport system permease protein
MVFDGLCGDNHLMMRIPSLQPPAILIRPSRGWASLKLAEVWEYRELFYFLVWRDIKVRYKQTVLGILWAVLQPFLTMVVFSIFFGKLANVESEGLPYPIFSYAALLPWTFFAQGLTQSANSLVGSSNLIKKIYFPRVIMPASSVIAGVMDFAFAFVVLLGMMAYYGIWPSSAIVFLPFLILLAFGASLGAGMWLSALNVEYRDIRYAVPFFVQLWLFVSPVIYPAGKVTEKLASAGLPGWLYGLNPMVGVIEGFRWTLLGVGGNPAPLIAAGAAVTAALLLSGTFFFRRMEKTFADIV